MSEYQGEEPQFPYDKTRVRLSYSEEQQLHIISIIIEDEPVNRMLFFSYQEAQNHLYNMELALKLGAKFNEQGYWGFELPPDQRSLVQEEYYRRAR